VRRGAWGEERGERAGEGGLGRLKSERRKRRRRRRRTRGGRRRGPQTRVAHGAKRGSGIRGELGHGRVYGGQRGGWHAGRGGF